MPDVLVTGLPRSGLTLVAALIDSLPDAVCLNSPQVQAAQARKLHETIPFCKWLAGDFVWSRTQLLRQEAVKDYRAADGSHVLDGLKDANLLRNETGEPALSGLVRPGLSDDFILAMKHDSLYSCVLPTLVQMGHFGIVAVIRHPYDVISSWRSLPGEPIGQGRLPFARHYWPEAALVDPEQEIGDLLDRMVQLYDLFMKRYHEQRDYIRIISYEDVVENPETVSEALGLGIVPPAASRIVRQKRIRDAAMVESLRERFQKYGTYTRYFYPGIY